MILWYCVLGYVTSSVTCPLELDHDELPTLSMQIGGKTRHMVVDTGSFNHVLFESSHSVSGHLRTEPLLFQSLPKSHGMRSSQPLIGQCGPGDVHFGSDIIVTQKWYNSIQGILGLSPMVLEHVSVEWYSASISLPTNSGGTLSFNPNPGERDPSWFRANSKHYWAAPISSLNVAGQVIELNKPTSVIFDSGSNFYGFTSGLVEEVRRIVHGCQGTEIAMVSGDTPIRFLHTPIQGTCTPAIFQVDQLRFAGHLGTNEIVIIGTRGMRGKTVNLHKSSMNDNAPPVYYISVN